MAAGQVNAFYRWKNIIDSAEKVEISLCLVNATDLKTQFEIPKEASVDVTLRRMQTCRLKPGELFHWTFGTTKGDGQADAQGLMTIPAVKITSVPTTLSVTK